LSALEEDEKDSAAMLLTIVAESTVDPSMCSVATTESWMKLISVNDLVKSQSSTFARLANLKLRA
jgi:hypothetical protein